MARLGAKRGEIWIADLMPGKGWEVAKKRPALIISSDYINSISPLVIVVPLSSQVPKVLGPERIFLTRSESKLTKDSVLFVNQIRAIDKSRLVKKVGSISKGKIEEVGYALKIVLGLEPLE